MYSKKLSPKNDETALEVSFPGSLDGLLKKNVLVMRVLGKHLMLKKFLQLLDHSVYN